MDRDISSFMGLPTEILQQIVDYAEHRDIESLSLSCRLLRDLAKTKLAQHRVLQRRFLKVEIGYYQWRNPRGQHPIQLLDVILDDPPIALYPTQIIIGDCYHHQDRIEMIKDPGFLRQDPYEQTHKDGFGTQVYQAVESYCFHTPRCQKSCHSIPWDFFAERILAHHLSPTLALLLALLANLEILVFEGLQSRPHRILKVVSDIVNSNYELPRYVFRNSIQRSCRLLVSKDYVTGLAECVIRLGLAINIHALIRNILLQASSLISRYDLIPYLYHSYTNFFGRVVLSNP